MDPYTFSGQNSAATNAPTGQTPGRSLAHESFDMDHTIRVKTPASGSMFFNRYRLDRVLGRGGMGVVWLADDLKLERPVALKFLPSLLGLDIAAVKELKTETRRGLELSHPNIVRIYDFVDDEEVAAISMEFVDGKTLSELRMGTEHGVFSVGQIMQWLPGVCAALDYAHFHRKLVHRDLKPANIMSTTKENVAKIADFGIARSLSDTMSRLSAANLGTSGTLPYMSPQQAMGERPMPTDDVYSLGATIYELLSGKPPFYRGDISTQITSKIPSSMLERRTELEVKASDAIPKEWENAIALCLRKDAAERPQSAGALAEMLGLSTALTSGATKTFVSTGQPTKAVASAGTAPAAAKSKVPLYAAAAAVLVAGGAAAYYFSTRPPATPVAAGSPAASAPAVAVGATPATTPTPGPAPAQEVQPAQPATAVTATPAPAAPVAGTAAVAAPSSAPGTTNPTATATPPPPAAGQPALAASTAPAAGAGAPVVIPAPGAAAAGAGAGVGSTPAMSTQLPDGTTVTAAVPPPVAMVQPPVTEPPDGHWPLNMLFPTQPQATYSENGRRHLLYEAQARLRELDLYNSTQDGKEGKGTHNAIVLFQARNNLVPNGLLDGPTLAAMELYDTPDEAQWKAPAVASSSSSSSSRRRQPAKEQPNLLQRAGKSIGKLFKRD